MQIIAHWLKELDRQRAMAPPVSRHAVPTAPHAQQPARTDIRVPKNNFDMSLGSEDGMAMSMSFNQSLRRPNPFTSSGSLSSSFMSMQHLQTQQQQQQQHGRVGGRPPVHPDAMQEEVYDDDWEEEVDTFDHNKHLPSTQGHRPPLPDAKHHGHHEESKHSHHSHHSGSSHHEHHSSSHHSHGHHSDAKVMDSRAYRK